MAWLVDRSNHVSIRFEVQKKRGVVQALEMPIGEWQAHCRTIEGDLPEMDGAKDRSRTMLNPQKSDGTRAHVGKPHTPRRA